MRRLLVLGLLAACGPRAHHHGDPLAGDRRTLYVELSAEGDHDDALHAGASAGLAQIQFASQRDLNTGGEIELQLRAREINSTDDTTSCTVKVLIVRLPKHSLLAMAEASGRARGSNSADDCVEGVTTALVRGKIRTALRRQLRLKR
ncbi:MAG TPA: hypothetical protein VMZ28_03395 [Kofleriaceae bacterium]|nr:hypothetical protein [Kofleriaceae bacterium]